MRILIVRLSAIGDTIHTLPLAAALRRLYPEVWIGWVVEKPSAPLVVDNPLLDWWHVLPKGWLKSFRETRRLRRILTEQKPDVVFDVQGLSKSAIAARLSGAPVRIGFTKGESREIAPYLDNRRIKPKGKHAIDKTLSLLAALDTKQPGPAEFVFPACSPEDAAAIADMPERFILMGPWGSFTAKLWPLERFLQTAVWLHERTGLRSYMLGHGDKERDAVRALSEQRPDVLQPAPDVSITGVVELARRASVFVGCDSFPMHAAAAVDCPTVGLFGVTNPERLGPYGPNGHAVYERLTLPRSTRERARFSNENMMALPVEKVVIAALFALQKRACPWTPISEFADKEHHDEFNTWLNKAIAHGEARDMVVEFLFKEGVPERWVKHTVTGMLWKAVQYQQFSCRGMFVPISPEEFASGAPCVFPDIRRF